MSKGDDSLRAGRSHLSRGELDLAVRAFRDALLENAEDVEAREGLGLALAKAGNYAGALEELERVCQKAPERESSRRARGEVLMRLGRFDQGVAELKRAMGSDRHKKQP